MKTSREHVQSIENLLKVLKKIPRTAAVNGCPSMTAGEVSDALKWALVRLSRIRKLEIGFLQSLEIPHAHAARGAQHCASLVLFAEEILTGKADEK